MTEPAAWPTPSGPERLRRRLRRWRRAVLRHRRPLAALCAAVAVGALALLLRPPAPPTSPVRVAAADLPAGHRLTAADLREVRLPRALAPEGATGQLLGRTLAAPVRTGEPVTDVRLVGASLTAGDPESRAVPVRLPDAESAALLEPGDRLDLHAAPADGGTAALLLSDVPVLAVPPSADESATVDGRLVVLGVPFQRVGVLASASVSDYLTYSFSR